MGTKKKKRAQLRERFWIQCGRVQCEAANDLPSGMKTEALLCGRCGSTLVYTLEREPEPGETRETKKTFFVGWVHRVWKRRKR